MPGRNILKFLKFLFTVKPVEHGKSEVYLSLNSRQQELVDQWRGENFTKTIMRLEQRIYELEERSKQ